MSFAKCLCVAIVVLMFVSETAFARGGRRQMQYQKPMYQQQSPIQNISYTTPGTTSTGTAATMKFNTVLFVQ